MGYNVARPLWGKFDENQTTDRTGTRCSPGRMLGEYNLCHLPGRKTRIERASQPAPSRATRTLQMFGGRITKSNGAYVLRASSGKTSYMLDDQKTAKHYEGKIVVVTGTMDKTNNLIHVQKIEAVA